MTDLFYAGAREHVWREYDERHRACERCGLRLFWTTSGQYGNWGRGGWCLLDFRGVPSPPLLGTGVGSFGACVPPPKGVPVFIEYTGDPDVHPGCERIMHRSPAAEASGPGLLDLGTLRPICGARCEWWELGPSRDWPGWNWCADCYPGRRAPGPPRLQDLSAKELRERVDPFYFAGAQRRQLEAPRDRRIDIKRYPWRVVLSVQLRPYRLVLECGHEVEASKKTARLKRTRCLKCSPSEVK